MKFSLSILASLMMVSSFAFAGGSQGHATCFVTGLDGGLQGGDQNYEQVSFEAPILNSKTKNEKVSDIEINYLPTNYSDVGVLTGKVHMSWDKISNKTTFTSNLTLNPIKGAEVAEIDSESTEKEVYDETGETVFLYKVKDGPKLIQKNPFAAFQVVCLIIDSE